MGADPPRLILDATRLVARAGRTVLTGIDRVERAWLGECLARDPAACLLVGTMAGQVLLPASAAGRILDWIDRPEAAPRPGRLLRMLAGRRAARAAALEALWPDATGPFRTSAALGRHLPASGGWLVSVGHQNAAGLRLVAGLSGWRLAVLVHDTIPIDLGDDPRAARRLWPVLTGAAKADLAICNSQVTAAALAHHAGPVRNPLVAPLGIDLAPPDPSALPASLGRGAGPAFLALGTIARRKGQDFLLDLWQAMAAAPPGRLILAGRIGRGGGPIVARAREMAAQGLPVALATDLSDGAVAALMEGAAALLAPSLAEGYGLPVAEAAARGLPVLANDLPAYREVVGAYPVYLPTGAAYPWIEAIRGIAAHRATEPATERRRLAVPGWKDHFDRVFAAMV